MFDQIIGYVKKLTEAGVALLALGIVLQVIFGKAVPFVGGDIIGNLTGIVATPVSYTHLTLPTILLV